MYVFSCDRPGAQDLPLAAKAKADLLRIRLLLAIWSRGRLHFVRRHLVELFVFAKWVEGRSWVVGGKVENG